ncbi:MAG TPA: GNAT family N-acetyltransferase [Vicinamibacterales bacterium]|nr:GNAT family N-acetyltransferase [Vicinamibacterales bacterium]
MSTVAPRDVAIRPMARRDLAEVVRLDAVHTGAAEPDYWRRVVADFVGRRTDRPRVGLVAECDGMLAGFVLADVRAFEFGSEPCGWILEIGVDPRFARQGLASRLLAETGRRLREAGVTTIRTMVRRSDVPLLTFFRTNGFAAGPYVQLEWTPESGE